MKRRVEAGHPALSGMFTRAEVTYAWPRDDGTVGSDREPVALFTGEAVPPTSSPVRCGDRGHVEQRARDRAWRGAWTGAHLGCVRRANMDPGCRRASRMTRGRCVGDNPMPVSERRAFLRRATKLGLHPNVLLGWCDNLMISARDGQDGPGTPVHSRSKKMPLDQTAPGSRFGLETPLA